ncbi:MAG TPA: hypothetical protein VLJ68_12840 [Chitinophagaceae bacterium]|nr:hypothetical protein [Chitinophagaceae bacterium]
MKKIALFILMLAGTSVYAQEKTRTVKKFHAMGSIGMLAGQSPVKPVIQFSSGMLFNKYYTGIGLSFDAYRFISFPLFVEGRMQFGSKREGFIYSGLGYNIPYNGKQSEEDPFATKSKYIGGAYFDVGLGWKPRGHISFSAGFSYKELTNNSTYVYECLIAPCPEEQSHVLYGLGRILAKMSIEIGR